jgi:hypothetical protein
MYINIKSPKSFKLPLLDLYIVKGKDLRSFEQERIVEEKKLSEKNHLENVMMARLLASEQRLRKRLDRYEG